MRGDGNRSSFFEKGEIFLRRNLGWKRFHRLSFSFLSPFLFFRFRYSLGVVPVISLKTRLKRLALGNPHLLAISWIDRELEASRRQAWRIRTVRRMSRTVALF